MNLSQKNCLFNNHRYYLRAIGRGLLIYIEIYKASCIINKPLANYRAGGLFLFISCFPSRKQRKYNNNNVYGIAAMDIAYVNQHQHSKSTKCRSYNIDKHKGEE